MDEEGAYQESDDAFSQVTIGAYKLGTMIKVSEELLNDSVFDIQSYLATEFARRIGNAEEEAFINGNGTGKPTGVLGTAEVGVTAAGAPDIILGRPVKVSRYMPAIASGNKTIAFGDFNYYWIADR